MRTIVFFLASLVLTPCLAEENQRPCYLDNNVYLVWHDAPSFETYRASEIYH